MKKKIRFIIGFFISSFLFLPFNYYLDYKKELSFIENILGLIWIYFSFKCGFKITDKLLKYNKTESNEPIKNHMNRLNLNIKKHFNNINNPHFTEKTFNEFVVLDFETTGLNANVDKIIEVSALKYKDNKLIDQYHTLINPGIKIPENITKINGITNNMVKDKPSMDKVLPELINFVENLPIVAHNASFDAKFLKYASLYHLGEDVIKNEFIDTLKIAQKIYPNLPNYKLQTIKEYLRMDLESHRAYDDTLVTAHIYIDYCNKIKEQIQELNYIKENLSKEVIYDDIDEDIYKCFIAYKSNVYQGGNYSDFLNIEDKISQICLEHGGKYYKTACKSAKFAIVFDYSSRYYSNIEDLRSRGYKVTTFEDALKFFNLEHMWNIEELKSKINTHKSALINYYNSQNLIQ